MKGQATSRHRHQPQQQQRKASKKKTIPEARPKRTQHGKIDEPWHEFWPKLVKKGWIKVRGSGREHWRYVTPTAAPRLSVPGFRPRLQLGCDYFLTPADVISHCQCQLLLVPTPPRVETSTPNTRATKKQKLEPFSDSDSSSSSSSSASSSPPAAHYRLTRQRAGPLPFFKRNKPGFACFAFNCTSSSDLVRMSALQDLFRVRITSASEQEASERNYIENNPSFNSLEHYSCDFKKSLLSGMDEETVVLMLDYFWLQGNWWAERYGENWVSVPLSGCKLARAFQVCSKLKMCILPLDQQDGLLWGRVREHRQAFLEGAQLEMECITWKEAQANHPLCLATTLAKRKYLKSKEERKSFDDQVRYVKGKYSFVVVHRRGLDWRALLRGYLKIH